VVSIQHFADVDEPSASPKVWCFAGSWMRYSENLPSTHFDE
jgi:hypothetical protein